MRAVEQLHGTHSIEFVESSLFYLDIIGYLGTEDVDSEWVDKIQSSLQILSKRTVKLIAVFMWKYIFDPNLIRVDNFSDPNDPIAFAYSY